MPLKADLRGYDYATQVQMLAPDGDGREPREVGGIHAAAAHGISGTGEALPHRAQIQRSFGGYDISNVVAHTGPEAMAGTSAMGADAFASGDHVALGEAGKGLHTVAHETAHVVQQEHGVALSGGVGAAGDRHEQHANAVADAVVQGKSAEGLLDQLGASGTSGAGSAVQMRESDNAPGEGGATSEHTAPGALAPIHGISGEAKARIRGGAAPSEVWVRAGGAVDQSDAKAKRHQAYDKTRVLGWNSEWFSALQTALGTRKTGHATPELADAVAEREEDAGRPVTGALTDESADWLAGLFPELAAIGKQKGFEDGGEAQETVRRNRRSEDLAISKLGLASSYAEFASSVLRKSTFCGHAVTGHPEFLARLANAETFLSARTDGLKGSALGGRLGITEVSSFRTNTAGFDNLLHGIGFAIDINPSTNNWNFGQRDTQAKMGGVMANVQALLGDKVVKSGVDLAALAKEGTTEEAFLAIAESNEALRRYRALSQDRAALETWLASPEAPRSAKRLGVATWLQRFRGERSWLRRRTGGATPAGAPPRGFMDFDAAVVSALRDAGGLRWGGLDFGEKINGDMMHFDQYSGGLGLRLRDEVRKKRQAAHEPFE